MRNFLTCLLIIFITCNKAVGQHKVTVIGSVHFPTKQVNADSIYHILQKIRPDLILMESDSTNFYDDFTFKHLYDENEYIAIVRYQMKHPKEKVRPIEIEGRNRVRKNIGIYSEAGQVWQRLNQLNNEKKFGPKEQTIWDELAHLDSVANRYKESRLQDINSAASDSTISKLIRSKYIKVKQLVDQLPLFNELKLIDAKSDTVTMRDYFGRWSDFEGHTRNRAIANNAIKWIEHYPDHKIVIITGFYHRPYLLDQLRKRGIATREFYH